MTKNQQLPGVLSRRTIRGVSATTGVSYFQPRFFPQSLPYQIDAIPEGTDPSTPAAPGTVFGVPPDAPGDEQPSAVPLSAFLTHPRTLVYVGYPSNPAVASTGTAVAPFREIADAMSWIAAHAGSVFEVDVAPGSYADFTVPDEKTVLLRAPALTVSAITVVGIGTLVFVEVQTFLGQAPAISFPVTSPSNAVYFDSPSAQAFGTYHGTIVGGAPICEGPGPYLALAGSEFAAFDSAVTSAQFYVELASRTPDSETVGIVYPEVASLSSGTCALVWPAGTMIPTTAGLGAVPLYRAASGNATATKTTQQIGNDDGARVYVDIRSGSSDAVRLYGVASPLALGVPLLLLPFPQTGIVFPSYLCEAATSLRSCRVTCNLALPAGTTIDFFASVSRDNGSTFNPISPKLLSLTTGQQTKTAAISIDLDAGDLIIAFADRTAGVAAYTSAIQVTMV